jgi:hypothetical protein
VIIPAFQNRFASIHEPVVALNTINRSAAFESSAGGSTFSTDPAARGVVTSPTAAAIRPRLDPTVMNVPVFPGNTVLMQQQGALGFGALGANGIPLNAGFGNTGVFVQQGSGSSLVPVDPFRTTATPGPAVNAVPNPAAPVPTIPPLQVPATPTIPVRQQNPTVLVPGTPAIQGTSQSQSQNQNSTATGQGTGTRQGTSTGK